MKINANTLKSGNVIDHLGKLWRVVKTEHVKPGKGGAFAQVEIKSLKEGTKKNERFRSAEQVEKVSLEENPYQYLYAEDDLIVLMDQATYEQMNVERDLLGESGAFLQDGMILNVCSHEGDIVSVTLPDSVIVEVTEAEPVVKGQTASSSFKPAMVDCGVRVMVPPHIDAGMRIVVNTADGTYVERAKD